MSVQRPCTHSPTTLLQLMSADCSRTSQIREAQKESGLQSESTTSDTLHSFNRLPTHPAAVARPQMQVQYCHWQSTPSRRV